MIQIELSIDKECNILNFKITDVDKEYVYNYMYSLASTSNINTLCTFLHNGKEVVIRNDKNNYMTISETGVEIKNKTSNVKQTGTVNMTKLHKEMTKMLFDNDYIDLKQYFAPSKSVLSNYKIKKFKFTEQEIKDTLAKLKKVQFDTKKIKVSPLELQLQRRALKKIDNPVPEKNVDMSDYEMNDMTNSETKEDLNKSIEQSTISMESDDGSEIVQKNPLKDTPIKVSDSDIFPNTEDKAGQKNYLDISMTTSELDKATDSWGVDCSNDDESVHHELWPNESSQINDASSKNPNIGSSMLSESMKNDYF